ncbi:MAG: hypothetical protein ACRDQA_15950 [Nocardioidaceae bacterium]
MDYDDGRVACTQDELLIRRYYFPVGSKRVPYEKIREVRSCPASKGRMWGSNDFVHWYNLDPHRAHKETGLIIDTGRPVKPVITPDDPDKVLAALTHHGVTVTS